MIIDDGVFPFTNLSDHIRLKINNDPNYLLMFAVYKQALLDAGIIRHGNGRDYCTKANWRDAVAWIMDRSDAVYSFNFISHGFGIEPSDARARMLNKK